MTLIYYNTSNHTLNNLCLGSPTSSHFLSGHTADKGLTPRMKAKQRWCKVVNIWHFSQRGFICRFQCTAHLCRQLMSLKYRLQVYVIKLVMPTAIGVNGYYTFGGMNRKHQNTARRWRSGGVGNGERVSTSQPTKGSGGAL